MGIYSFFNNILENTGIGNLAYAGRVGIMPEISVLQIS